MRVVSGVNNLDLVSNIKKTKNIKKNDSLNEKDFKSVLKEKKDSTIEKEEIIKPLDKKNTNEVDKKVEGNNFLEKADKNSNVEDSSTEAIKEISYDDISGMEEDLSDVSLESLLSLLFLINGKEGNDFSKLDVSKLKNSVELLTSEVLKQKVILNDGSLNIEMLENPEGIELNKFLADITKEIKSVDMKVHGNNILNTDNHFKDMIIKALNSKGVSNSEIKELSLNLKIIENPFLLDDSKRSKVLDNDILASFKFEDMEANDDSKNMKSFSSNKFIELNPSLNDSKVGINLND
ncbi:hypothetical protein, partial [uncultured Clostridium sp.]|uniref:hypothetical protein n=1 Tax=uncultured Clostridium sp. TaxID=59620 RepID=UPI00262F8032